MGLVESPGLRLREGAEVDVNIFLTDEEIDINRKVKRAFCEPQNVEFCPPIAWVFELLHFFHREFKVAGKPGNGGDRVYTNTEDMRKDFASGELHPGDLKPALSKCLNAFLKPLRDGVMSQDRLQKAVEDLHAQAKMQSKKK